MPSRHLTDLFKRRPELAGVEPAITQAYETLRKCFRSGGTVLLCGNGGSAADADHWAGELLKGFCHDRPLAKKERGSLRPASSCGRAASVVSLRSCWSPYFLRISGMFYNSVMVRSLLA